MEKEPKDYSLRHEEIRKKLWCDAWVAVANTNDCKYSDTPTKWADAALKQFDLRFKNPEVGEGVEP